MSDDATDSTPKTTRKSGRERKPVIRLSTQETTKANLKKKATTNGNGKRKRVDPPSAEEDSHNESEPDQPEEEEDQEEDDEEEEEVDELEEDSDDEFEAKKPSAGKGKKAAKPTPNGKEKPKKAPAKPRKSAAKKKKKDVEDGSGAEDADEEDQVKGNAGKAKGDTKVNNDNKIYNAVKNPNAALQAVVDDWIESYDEESPGIAMAELINFVFRTCGCNAVIDQHQAEDENGIVDVLDEIQEDFKNSAALAYPLISRTKTFKKFRSSLTTFLNLLFTSTAASQTLYDETFCQLLQSWLGSLSSSKIRAFRHTATVIALTVVQALCGVTVGVNKEFAQASRAKEAEEKKGRKDKARLKDLGKNVGKVHERKVKLEQYLTDLFAEVFVHRYRDSDPMIRTECIKALGGWMKIHPDYWLEGNYLRYIGWVLSDDHKDVRHESVKALIALYAKEDHIGSMQHFTDRFKGQLVKMATGEIDLSVRVACILVLRQIDKHGLLEEEQRDQVAVLVFEKEKRVRNAVGGLWKGLLEEVVLERETVLQAESGGKKKKGKKDDEKEEEVNRTRLNLKCLAELLVKYGKVLDGPSEDDEENEEDQEDDEGVEGIADLVMLEKSKADRGRITLAVEALWEEVEVLRDWHGILDFVLLDHSATPEDDDDETESPRSKLKKKAAARKEEDLLEAYKLTEEEETLLVEVLASSLGKTMGSSGQTKKEKEDGVKVEITRTLIEALPRLFTKHQTVPIRIVDILSIPCLILLDLYLELRNVTAYEGLWDDVTKQFMKHTDSRVMDQAVKTVRVLLGTDSLRNTNTNKMMELEETVVEALRTVVAGKDVETSTFDDDELFALGANVARIDKIYTTHDVSLSLDDTDEGEQSSAWEIVDSLSARGRLGYKDESKAIEHALSILYNHLSWRIRVLIRPSDIDPDPRQIAAVVEARRSLLDRLEDFSVGTTSNASESVKQTSINILLQVFISSGSITSSLHDPEGHFADLKLPCGDELQARCAGFVEAEIERYAETLADLDDREDEDQVNSGDSDSEADSDDEAAKKKSKKKKAAAKKAVPAVKAAPMSAATVRAANAKKQAKLLAEGQFIRTIGSFARAIHGDIVNLTHASVILVHYERFGGTFDLWAKLLVQDMREEAIYGANAELVSRILIASLENALDLLLADTDKSEERLVALARLLNGALIVRGAQLSIAKRLESEYHVQIHLDCAAYAVKKIAAFEESKKKDKRNKSISFFKALAQLLVGLEGRDTLTIKTALDASLEAAELNVPVTTKAWEPLRAYLKRLVTATAKDPTIEAEAKKKAKRAPKKAASDIASNVGTDSASEEDTTPEPAPKAAHRARRLPARSEKEKASDDIFGSLPARQNPPPKRAAPAAVDNDTSDDDTQHKANGAAAKKRKVEEKGKGKQVQPQQPEEDSDEDVADQLLSSQRSTQSRKRVFSSELSDEDESEVEEVEDQLEVAKDVESEVEEIEEEVAANEPLASLGRQRPPVSTASSQASLSDLKKRKRKKVHR